MRSLLLVALAALPATAQVIRLQVIHNPADPTATVVDVYVNGALTLDDFAFRTATPFLPLPSNTDLTVAVAPGTSTGAGDAVFSQTFNLPVGAYQLIASGVLTPADFAPNPNERPIAFQLVPALNVREVAAMPDAVDIRVVHGATDAPTVNVRSGGVTIVGDIAYSEVTASYWPLFPGVYPLDITLPDGTPVASFAANLSGSGGAAATVRASGFLAPASNQNGPAFGLLAVFADGTTALLPSATVSTDEAPEGGALRLGAAAPNPLAATGTVAFSLDVPGRATLALYDALGRRVATLADGDFAADCHEAALATAGLAAGVYVLRLETASGRRTRTVTVVR